MESSAHFHFHTEPFTHPEFFPFDPLPHLKAFEARFPRAFALMRTAGIHPTSPVMLQNPFTGLRSEESFRNIGEHSLAVAVYIDVIGRLLVDRGYLDGATLDKTIERGLFHDIAKPFSVMHRSAGSPNAGDIIRFFELLVRNSVRSDEELDKLLAAGNDVGHIALKNILQIDAGGAVRVKQGILATKLLNLADLMTYTTLPFHRNRPHTFFILPSRRVVRSEMHERYPFLFKEGLAATAEGSIREVKGPESVKAGERPLGNFASMLLLASHQIADEIAGLLTDSNDYDAEQLLLEILRKAL